MKKNIFIFLLLIIASALTVIYQGCSQSKLNNEIKQESIARYIFSNEGTHFVVHVYFEDGAAPYTGNIGISGDDTWDVTEKSFEKIFETHTYGNIVVPKAIGNMTKISDQKVSSWNTQLLTTLADSLGVNAKLNGNGNIFVVFLNGYLNGNTSVLGVQISGYPYAFVFKDVVTNVGGDSVSQRYVEQATVVHEIGHAIGLVNNGIPLFSSHEDGSHLKHTTNSDGVMYWQVESSDSILSFLVDIIAGNQLNLFGVESVQDAHNFHP